MRDDGLQLGKPRNVRDPGVMAELLHQGRHLASIVRLMIEHVRDKNPGGLPIR